MTTHVIHGPGELIASLPFVLGFEPQESVVVVALSANGEIALAMRADREDLLLPDIAHEVASSIAAQLRRARARSAIIVSFTDVDVSWGCDAADALLSTIDPVVDHTSMWTTDGFTYRAPGCADVRCCPPGGVPVPPTQAWPAGERMLFGTSRAGTALATGDDRDRRRAARAGDRWWRRREADPAGWRSAAVDALVDSASRRSDVLDLGRAAVSLRDVRVRDALLVSWLDGGARAVADVLAGRTTAEVAAVLEGALRDRDRPGPRLADVHVALEWCEQVVALARGRDRAAVHALAAVIHWYGGDQASATVEAALALACDDGYSLAGLVMDMCEAGLEPAWLQR